jgi:branched-chain amino acid transport system substrate-binding protein
MRRSITTVTAAAMAAGLALAGCGGASNTNSSAVGASGAGGGSAVGVKQQVTTPAVSSHLHGTPIKIMIAGDLSSPANLPELPAGAEARVAALNTSGGIDGHPVDLLVCDDNNPSPDACARKAVSAKVAAVVGAQSAGINPILLANGIAQVGNAPFYADDYTKPNSFPIDGYIPTTSGLIKVLAGAGCKKVTPLVLSGASSGDDANRYMHQAQASTPGVSVLTEVGVPFGLPDLSAQVTKATTNGSDCVAAVTFPSDTVKILQAARSEAVTEKFAFFPESLPQELVDQLHGDAEGVYEAGSFRALSSPNPAMVQFRREMAKYEPYAELSDLSINSWAAVKLFEIAAQTALTRYHRIDAASIYKVMPTLTNVNLGVTAPISFNKPGPIAGAPRIFNTEVFFSEVKHGVLVDLSEAPHAAY